MNLVGPSEKNHISVVVVLSLVTAQSLPRKFQRAQFAPNIHAFAFQLVCEIYLKQDENVISRRCLRLKQRKVFKIVKGDPLGFENPVCGKISKKLEGGTLWRQKSLFIVSYEIFFFIIFLGRVFHNGNVLLKKQLSRNSSENKEKWTKNLFAYEL